MKPKNLSLKLFTLLLCVVLPVVALFSWWPTTVYTPEENYHLAQGQLATKPEIEQTGPGGYQINWSVIGSAGASRQSNNYQLSDTLGQPIASGAVPMSSPNYSLQSGFWAYGGSLDLLLLGVVSFDNDLSGWAKDVIESFRQGTALNPEVRVVLLVDTLGNHNTEILEIANGIITPSVKIPWLSVNTFELSTAEPNQVAEFLQWGRDSYPAGKTMVTFIGHGTGPAPEISLNNRSPVQFSALPRPYRQRPEDVHNRQFLSTPELGEILDLATNSGAEPFDIVFLDQCFGGSLDVLYEIKDAADVFIASPNYAWGAFPYEAYLANFTAVTTNKGVAEMVINHYYEALDDTHPNNIFWLHQSDIENIATATTQLADVLRPEINQHESLILEAVLASQFADTTLTQGDLELAPPDELIGLGSLASNLQLHFAPTSTVYVAAENVLDSLSGVRSRPRVGQPWSNETTTWVYTDTLTVLAPLTRTLTTAEIWRASIYTSTAPLAAVWAMDPSNPLPVTIQTPLQYTSDGTWDEFIAEWYTTGFTPSIGLFFPNYPQTNVPTGTQQILEVKAQAGVNQISLRWDKPAALNPADYAIYMQLPGLNDWSLLAVLENNKKNYKHFIDFSGEYHYRIFARNSQKYVIASSTVISVAAQVVLPIQPQTESNFNSIRIEWNTPNNPLVHSYNILRSPIPTPTAEIIGNTRETVYFDLAENSNLEPGILYCYQIQGLSQTGGILETSNQSCAYWKQVELEIANIRGQANSSTIVPVRIRNAQGLQIDAGEFWIDFDPQVVSVMGVRTTALTDGYDITLELQSYDVLSRAVISLVGEEPIPTQLYDQGALFWLDIELADGLIPGRDAPFFWRSQSHLSVLDETQTPVLAPLVLKQGSVAIANTYMVGDVSGNGVINRQDAQLALTIANKKPQSPPPDLCPDCVLMAGDINSNGRVDTADAAMILYFVQEGVWPHDPPAPPPLQAMSNHTITVALDNPTGQQGELVTLVFTATDLIDMAGGRVVFAFDTAVIEEITAVELLTFTQAFTIDHHLNESGLSVAVASDEPLSGSGGLFRITLRLKEDAPAGSNPIQIAEVRLNDVYGRDMVHSALQYHIERLDGSIFVPFNVFLPLLLR